MDSSSIVYRLEQRDPHTGLWEPLSTYEPDFRWKTEWQRCLLIGWRRVRTIANQRSAETAARRAAIADADETFLPWAEDADVRVVRVVATRTGGIFTRRMEYTSTTTIWRNGHFWE